MSFLFKVAACLCVLELCSCLSQKPSPQPNGSWLAKIKGRADARKDLQAGKLVVEIMGPPPPMWMDAYQRLAKERYGIEHRWVAGCMLGSRVMGHAEGYNEIMEAEIERRFGKDASKKTADEAQKMTPLPSP